MALRSQSKSKALGKQEVAQARKNAKAAKKIAQKIAKDQIKEMRPYLKKLKEIDLRREISPAKRSFLNKAWREYQELTTRPFKVYRTKNKQRLKIAQEFSRHEKGKPKFDVAFVPTADPKAKIRFKKDRVEIISRYVTETVLFFNLVQLAANPESEIARALAKNTKAKQFVIMAGKYLYNGGLARSLVSGEVQKLMSRYHNPQENNYYQNWLFGIVAAEYSEQAAADEYRREYSRQRETIKKGKRSDRRKRGIKYGKKF